MPELDAAWSRLYHRTRLPQPVLIQSWRFHRSFRNHYPRNGDWQPASQAALAQSLLPAQCINSSVNA